MALAPESLAYLTRDSGNDPNADFARYLQMIRDQQSGGAGLLADPIAGRSKKGGIGLSDDEIEKLIGKPDRAGDFLSNMAVRLAEAGKPGPRPASLLGALGGALGGGAIASKSSTGDYIKQLGLAQELRALRQKYMFAQEFQERNRERLDKLRAGQPGGSVPTPTPPSGAAPGATPPVDPNAAPAGGLPQLPSFSGGRAGGLPSYLLPSDTAAAPAPAQDGQTAIPPPSAAGAGGGDSGGLLADPNDPLSSLPPEIRQMLAARAQGGPAAGSTPAPFRDDARYTSMVAAPASARAEDGIAGSSDDPRGKIPVILAAAQRYRVNPSEAIAVAKAEGLERFSGDGGKSGGAFQLYTGGGLGNEFQKETGLNPLDPKNEDATIDYALKRVAQGGWGPWVGARKLGLTGRGAGPLAVAGGGAGMAQGVAEATGTPGLPPELAGLLALATAGDDRPSPFSGRTVDPLAGLLSAGAGGGDDGGSLPGDLVTGLKRPSVSVAPLTADPRAEPPAQPTSSARELAAYATGNARPGRPSSVEGLNPQFANAVSRMVADMPPELRARFQIISGHRDAARQMEVNPSAPNSRHIPGLAADLGNDPAVLNWIRENGSKYDVGFPLAGAKEANHLEFLPGGLRTGGAGTRLPRAVTDRAPVDLPDVRAGLLGGGEASGIGGLPPELQGLLSLATEGSNRPSPFADNATSGGSTPPAEISPFGAGGAGGGDEGGYLPPTASGLRLPGGGIRVPPGFSGTMPAQAPAAPSAASPAAPGGMPSGGALTGPPQGQMPAGLSTPGYTPTPGYDPIGQARELAILDSMAKLGGIDAGLKEEADLLFKDPRYAAELERAKQAAGAPFELQKQKNQYLLDEQKATYQSFLDKQKEWAGKGMMVGPDGKTMVPIPGFGPVSGELKLQAEGDLERLKTKLKIIEQQQNARAGAEYNPVPGGVIVQDEKGNKSTVPMTQAEMADRLREQAAGKPRDGRTVVGAPFQSEQDKQTSEAELKYSYEKLKDADEASKIAIQRDTHIAPLAQAAQKVKTGKGAETMLELKKVLKAFNIIKGEDIPDGEAMQQGIAFLKVQAAPKGQGSVSNFERPNIEAQIMSMATTPDGFIRALDILNRINKYDKDVARIHHEVARESKRPNWLEAQSRIDKLSPLTPEQIDLLNAPTVAAPPAAAPPPLQPGAIQPDGSYRSPYGTVGPAR